MLKEIIYAPNSDRLDKALANFIDVVPCFITREYIEMNYSKITIICRNEDAHWMDTLKSLFKEV